MLEMKNKKEIILYVAFGLLTTVVSIVTYQVFEYALGAEYYLISNVFSWIFAVSFAFFTNKRYVFESKSWEAKVVKKEILGFFLARLFSLLLEEAGLFVLVDLIGLSDVSFVIGYYILSGSMIAKLVMQVIVIVSNYFFSKFLIFNKK